MVNDQGRTSCHVNRLSSWKGLIHVTVLSLFWALNKLYPVLWEYHIAIVRIIINNRYNRILRQFGDHDHDQLGGQLVGFLHMFLAFLALKTSTSMWCFQTFLISSLPGEMIQFDEYIFLKWVGSTTNLDIFSSNQVGHQLEPSIHRVVHTYLAGGLIQVLFVHSFSLKIPVFSFSTTLIVFSWVQTAT